MIFCGFPQRFRGIDDVERRAEEGAVDCAIAKPGFFGGRFGPGRFGRVLFAERAHGVVGLDRLYRKTVAEKLDRQFTGSGADIGHGSRRGASSRIQELVNRGSRIIRPQIVGRRAISVIPGDRHRRHIRGDVARRSIGMERIPGSDAQIISDGLDPCLRLRINIADEVPEPGNLVLNRQIAIRLGSRPFDAQPARIEIDG